MLHIVSPFVYSAPSCIKPRIHSIILIYALLELIEFYILAQTFHVSMPPLFKELYKLAFNASSCVRLEQNNYKLSLIDVLKCFHNKNYDYKYVIYVACLCFVVSKYCTNSPYFYQSVFKK